MAVNQVARNPDYAGQDQKDRPEPHQNLDCEGALRRDEEQCAEADQSDSQKQCRKSFEHGGQAM